MLTAQHITYSIGEKTLLNDVSLAFEPGQMNLIIGANGAGKSTLMRVLSGLCAGYTGEVLYDRRNIRLMKENELAVNRAVLSQQVEVAFPMSVGDVVMMGRYPHFSQMPSKADRQICHDAIRLFELEKLTNRNYMTLSGGEKQRVHFARVCAQIWDTGQQACRYLLLDEPLTFLDIHYQLDLMEKLSLMLRNNRLVVLGVLHDLNLAIKYAHHILLLHEGRIIAQGTKKEVLTAENIKTAFRIEPKIVTDEMKEIIYLLI